MSRTRASSSLPVNPAKRTYEWSGKRGTLEYYDKARKERVEVRTPFAFLYLDSTSCVTGFHKPSKSNIYSNEVRRVNEDPLSVKSWKGGPIATGMWQTIRERVLASKGKFTCKVYFAFKIASDELEIGCILLAGAALSAWYNFTKDREAKKRLNVDAVVITGSLDKTNGDVDYKEPVFAFKEASKDTKDAADTLDRQLQDYFDEYFAATQKPATVPANVDAHASDVETQDSELSPSEVGDDDVPF